MSIRAGLSERYAGGKQRRFPVVPPKILWESSSTTRIPARVRSAVTSLAILRSSSEVPSIPAKRRNSDVRLETGVIGRGIVTIDTDGGVAVTVGTQVRIFPEVVKSFFVGDTPGDGRALVTRTAPRIYELRRGL